MIETEVISNSDTGKIEQQIEFLLKEYEREKKPIEVSFRDIIAELKNPDRATHLIHTYPAKLLAHIPYFFLNNNCFSKPGDIVLDPFSGSGTVLLESILADRNAIGSDSNPLARLISTVKTTKLPINELKKLTEKICEQSKFESSQKHPFVINIDHWFYPHVKENLNNIYHCINSIENKSIKNFFLVCFSNCVKKVSLADPRVSVPVRLRYDQYGNNHPLYQKTKQRLDELVDVDVLRKFREICYDNIKRLDGFSKIHSNNSKAMIVSDDARDLMNCSNPVKDNSVDLVITSPPYAGAQKYIRACSLSLGWLDMIGDQTLSSIEKSTIGRETYKIGDCNELKVTGVIEADRLLKDIFNENRVRANIASNYLLEMGSVLDEIQRVTKKGGYMVLVAANNEVCGREFKTQEYLHAMVEDLGFKTKLKLIDHIKSRGLMTKRNKTASLITREWVTVYQK